MHRRPPVTLPLPAMTHTWRLRILLSTAHQLKSVAIGARWARCCRPTFQSTPEPGPSLLSFCCFSCLADRTQATFLRSAAEPRSRLEHNLDPDLILNPIPLPRFPKAHVLNERRWPNHQRWPFAWVRKEQRGIHERTLGEAPAWWARNSSAADTQEPWLVMVGTLDSSRNLANQC